MSFLFDYIAQYQWKHRNICNTGASNVLYMSLSLYRFTMFFVARYQQITEIMQIAIDIRQDNK